MHNRDQATRITAVQHSSGQQNGVKKRAEPQIRCGWPGAASHVS